MPKAAKRPHLTSASSSSKRSRLTAVAVSPNSPAKRIINSFQPDPFYPYLFSNPHFQTILAHLYPPPPHVVYHRILIRTDDAQAVVKVDIANGTSLAPVSSTPSPWFAESPISVPKSSSSSHTYEHFPSSPPVAVVLHGLESNSTSNVTLRIVHALTTQNFKVFALNYRACADTDQVPTTLRLYHAGFTEDLETLLRAIKNAAIHVKRRPPPVYICGFSLGANIVCNFLGHRASDATRLYNVVAAAAACVPFDPTSCQRKLDSGLRGAVYSARLVSTMQEKVEAAHRHGVDISPCLPEKLRAANRIGLIDEYFIAPVFGFKDRYDYYHQVDARKILHAITVPILIINSRDDPFFDHGSGQSLPTIEQLRDAPILLHLTDHGGHCGFLDKAGFQPKAPGYFQTQFARFFAHVRDNLPRLSPSQLDRTLPSHNFNIEAPSTPSQDSHSST